MHVDMVCVDFLQRGKRVDLTRLDDPVFKRLVEGWSERAARSESQLQEVIAAEKLRKKAKSLELEQRKSTSSKL